MLLNVLVVIIGVYCMLESISAAADMHGGDRLCRVSKYLLASVSGAMAIYSGVTHSATMYMLVMIASVALCIWPRMVYRLFGGQRNTDSHADRVPQ